MSEEGIVKSLESFCDAEMLGNWSMGSPRVAVYTAFMKANKRLAGLYYSSESVFESNDSNWPAKRNSPTNTRICASLYRVLERYNQRTAKT